jgi:gluconokinase
VEPPRIVVIMGVSGSGKTTIGIALAAALGWEFVDGDDMHPPANVSKMAAGVPLTDDDRSPWLEAIGRWIDVRRSSGAGAVVACSALRRSYRDLLWRGRSEVAFCYLAVDPEHLRDRLARRRGHYMPASLLASQLATLEPLDDDEPGVTVAAEGEPADVLAEALDALGLASGEGSVGTGPLH